MQCAVLSSILLVLLYVVTATRPKHQEHHKEKTKVIAHDLSWFADTAAQPKQQSPQSMIDKNYQNLEKQVLAMAGKGNVSGAKAEGLETIKELITNTLLPELQTNARNAQAELDRLVAAGTACTLPSFTSGPLQRASAARQPAKVAHDECRATENKAFDENTVCQTALKSLLNAKNSACSTFDAVKKKDPTQESRLCQPGAVMDYRAWLISLRDNFAAKIVDYDNLKAQCDQATNAYNVQVPKCEASETGRNNVRASCNTRQVALEDAYCKVRQTLNTTCAEYNACYDKASSDHRQRKPVLESEDEARKLNFQVLKRIECLLPILNGGNSAAIEACKSATYDQTSLNLNYASIPSKGVCPDEGHMPCDADYRQTLYGTLPAGALAADCKLCPGTSLIELPAFVPGTPTSSRVCQNGAVFEFTDSWDCRLQDLQSQSVTLMPREGWVTSFNSCAKACAETPECSSFNYPKSVLTFYNCWIKTGYKKAISRGWDCGVSDSRWTFFTKIPGVTCTTPKR